MNFNVKIGCKKKKNAKNCYWTREMLRKKAWSYYIYVMKEFRTQHDKAGGWITKIYEELLQNWLVVWKVLKQSEKVSFSHIFQ